MGQYGRHLTRPGQPTAACFRVLGAVLVAIGLGVVPAARADGSAETTPCAARTASAVEVQHAYLVSRSLTTFPGLASHRFIAIGRYPGDPEAEIISFSNEKGLAGRNDDRAMVKDRNAWLRLDPSLKRTRRLLRGVNAALIPAPAGLVRQLSDTLIEDMGYNIFGPNSNTLAQAIANRAAGEDVRVYENRLFGALGRKQWAQVSFEPPGQQILLAVERGDVHWCPPEHLPTAESVQAVPARWTSN